MAYLLELAPLTKIIILLIIGMISREVAMSQSTTSGDLLPGTNMKLNNHVLYFDSLRIGYNSLTAPLTIANFTTGGALPPAGTILHAMQQGNLSNARVTLDDYSNTTRGSNFMGRKARNTPASPQPPITNDVLAAFTGDGWGVDSFHNKAIVGVVLRADSGTWSNTSSPSKIVLSTTPDGSTTQVDGFILDRNSKIYFPKLPNGIIRTDAAGGATAGGLVTSDITSALGYTPANAAATDTTSLSNRINAKFAIPTGNTSQYLRGDGTTATFPSIPDTTSLSNRINAKYTTPSGSTAQYVRGDGTLSTLPIYTAGTGIGITSNVVSNTAPDQVVSITPAGYGLSVSGTYPSFTITNQTPTFNNAPSVTINTSNQLSTTKNTRVSYTVSVASLVSVGQAIAFLEISANNSTWVSINSAGETSVGLLNTKSYNLQGEVPAGWYRRIRSAVTLGGQVSYVSGQEVQY